MKRRDHTRRFRPKMNESENGTAFENLKKIIEIQSIAHNSR
jgi:hypothetical protein